MRGDDHEQRALALERDVGSLEASGGSGASIVELLWGAGFQWIAFGCQRKWGEHKEKHEGLVRYLRDRNANETATLWNALEQFRQGAFYGHQDQAVVIHQAKDLLKRIRAWATL